MKSIRRQAFVLATVATALCALFGVGSALAQAYPAKPITIVVAYPAGGDTDAMARVYAEQLQHKLGQPVLVDNKPGASGTIGAAFVAKSKADGYTLLMAPSTFAIAQLVLKTGSGSAYDEVKSFAPVVMTGVQPLFLAVNADAGTKDTAALVGASKAKALSYASPGSGSPMHILGEMFNKATGAQLSHVPYRGVAPAINDVLGGHVPATFITYGPVAPYLANGKMKLLAVADPQRSSLAPNVPTLAEQGIKGVEVGAWQGIYAPAGTPPEIVKLLNTHMNDVLKMPEIVSKMAVFGALPAGGEAARLAKATADDNLRFGKIIKELGIQAD
ncbi:Bug family tripartite tricarboxylate transporter substrate binding protein [Variovorax sp. HJSM1_2]|uniref:Bug family tripartite tricarboxylate transporter substrate binding protein n=1 Tax=Variovorax sp. HJSM1_2 TaxID=3366263 RepID=UPI003BEBB54C